MPDIKIKKKANTIKAINKTAIMKDKLKNYIVNINKKAKETYDKNEGTSEEYAENKIQSNVKSATYYGVGKVNQVGIKSIKGAKKNIPVTMQKINEVKEDIAKTKKVGEKAIKSIKNNIKNIKSATKPIKTADVTVKTPIKTTKGAINKTGKFSKETAKKIKYTSKLSKKTIKRVKNTTQRTTKTIKMASKTIIEIIKMMIATAKTLLLALFAGGWVVILIIVIICLIGLICSSVFGIFFSNEKGANKNKTMSAAMQEVNAEFTDKITTIQLENYHDDYEISSSRANWKDILSIYAVYVTTGANQSDVMIIDDEKIKRLKEVFWDMNEITYRTENHTTTIEVINDDGSITEESHTRTILYIDVKGKTVEEMIEQYNFNDDQKLQLAEIRKEEYNSLWFNVLYGSNGSMDIVQVALAQVGNIGGDIFWSWYGYEARVDWCACFVSFCANECGYIESGIIPKFANCEYEGASWFKTCGLWQERGYIPKERRDCIFRLVR